MVQMQDIVLPAGTVLHGRYRIQHTISRGGFGNVYLATDQKFNRDVAVKEAYFNDLETKEQFALEADVLIHTNHVGVVRGFEDFEENGRFYLVMQYILGQNLEEMQIAHFQLYQRPLPETVVLPLMALICASTQVLHNANILHRDIKPANIKVDERGQPVLLDLGLAKLYKDPTSVTLMAARAYTPGYAPPEQCQDDGNTTQITDVYALGATTYYALTGRQPWEAMKRLAELHLGHPDMPSPRAFVPEVSLATDALVMQALALDPTQRFATPTAMQRAIEESYQQMATALLCPHCHTVNAAGSEFCGACGTVLRPRSSPMPPSPQSVFLAAVVPPPEQPTAIIPPKPALHRATAPMILRPEPVAPRIAVPFKRRMSTLATVALSLSIVAVFAPVVGQLFALFFIIPMSLIARGNIRKSQGSLRGNGRAIFALLISLGNIIGWPLVIYYQITGHLPKF